MLKNGKPKKPKIDSNNLYDQILTKLSDLKDGEFRAFTASHVPIELPKTLNEKIDGFVVAASASVTEFAGSPSPA